MPRRIKPKMGRHAGTDIGKADIADGARPQTRAKDGNALSRVVSATP